MADAWDENESTCYYTRPSTAAAVDRDQMNLAATVVSLLTPPGRGALATIGVRGPHAWMYTNACVTPPIDESLSPRPWLRDFRGVQGTSEELVVVFPSGNEARIHCHGGQAACEAVLQALESQGAKRIDWKEWAGDVNPAGNALADALTERTALILLDQMQGAFAKEINGIAKLQNQSNEAIRRLDELIARSRLGLHLAQPWKVVIAGRPNAGKSSLLNALLGFQRSITSPQPGTTRDVVTARTAIDGWPIELRDTAGLRISSDEIESAGVALAEQELDTADLVLYLIPADESPQEAEEQLATLQKSLQQTSRFLVVRTKADLSNQTAAGLAVSSFTGEGFAELLATIVERLSGVVPMPGAAVPITAEQLAVLQEMRRKASFEA
jgi:tRNA modification GTPase